LALRVGQDSCVRGEIAKAKGVGKVAGEVVSEAGSDV
jgi:hypothetical protein